jgi:menaquinone-dependent protoporphyrinogen IX oxidase
MYFVFGGILVLKSLPFFEEIFLKIIIFVRVIKLTGMPEISYEKFLLDFFLINLYII